MNQFSYIAKFIFRQYSNYGITICFDRKVLPNGEEAGLGIIPSKARWERKQGKKNRRLVFHGSRSSTSLDRSASGASNGRRHGKGSHGQKIAFSRKFPFMKSRERLNNLPDEDDDVMGDGHDR